MTNYEKYKDEIIDMLISSSTCSKLVKLRGYGKKCTEISCCACMPELKQWLEAEAPVFDLEELEAGDKIKTRKLGGNGVGLYEVVCNSFPAMWLRLRASENGVHQASDENFLISYDDLLEKYDVGEVIRND